MPTVPRYDSFQASPNTLPNARFEAQQMPDTAGRQAQETGRAMSNLGQHLGAIAQDMQREADSTVAKDIDAQTTSAINDALYHPENGFMVKQGKGVVEGYGDAVDKLKNIHREALNSAQNPAVRQMLAPVLDTRLNQAVEAINRHSGTETRRYRIQTSDARAITSLQDAALNYDDDKRFSMALEVAREETAALAGLQGWDEATAKLQATKYQDSGYKMRYEAWRIKDPVGAFAHFQKNAEQISPSARENIGTQLFHAAAPEMARQLNQLGGVGMVAPNASEGDGQLPRGIRNNNPGNITWGAKAWQGEMSGSDPKYATFTSPEAGIRAMGKTLMTYQDKYQLNTVEGIISRWAPATENDTTAYINTVAKALGVKPGAPIDLHDSDTLTRITRAMIQVENGPEANRITDEQIAVGLNAARGGVLPQSSPTVQRSVTEQTGYPVIDALPSDWKLHVMQLARTRAHQDMAESRDALRGKVQDATAEYMTNGFSTNPPTEGEFIRAYGQSEGVGHYREFQNVAVLGQNIQQIKTIPAANMVELVKLAKPVPGEGFANRQRNYEILIKAVDQVQQARMQDPVAYAISTGSYGIKPIERFDNPQSMAQELTRRAAAAPSMAADYGTPPKLLTKSEAQALSATLKASPVDAQKTLLATVYRGVSDMNLFKQTMQAIAPDNPTVAVAGIYQARGLRTTQSQDVADLILRGQAILTPNTKEDGTGHAGGKSLIKMPEEKLLLSDWNNVTGDAFKGKEQAADLFMQTSKAIYAARSAEEGDYSGVMDSKRWKASIMLATGGIANHNGANIITPYGMGYDQFQDALKVQADRLARDGAVNTTASEMMRLPVENIGDGRYLFRRGAGYLVGKDGAPLVADLNRSGRESVGKITRDAP